MVWIAVFILAFVVDEILSNKRIKEKIIKDKLEEEKFFEEQRLAYLKWEMQEKREERKRGKNQGVGYLDIATALVKKD